MKEGYFINIAFDKAIKLYLANKENQESVIYNSFLVVVIRVLALIYKELDIINPYYLSNEVVFLNNLSKYGVSKTDIALFKEDFLNYYNFELENNNQKLKTKNPYFKIILKYLVKLFVAKRKSISVSFQEEEEFLDLIYTTHTKNPYRLSYNYLMEGDSLYIEDYYYNALNEMDMTKDLGKPIDIDINLDALEQIGVNLTNLTNMSNKEVNEAKNKAYQYFEIDATSPSKNQELEYSLDYFKTYGKKVTSGNGYVDILLLMSVIATSFSIILIIILSL